MTISLFRSPIPARRPNPRTSHRGLRNGFTIVEVLLAVAVFAILLSLWFPVVAAVRESALRNQTRAQLAQYAIAYEAFRADRGHYPTMGADGPEFRLRGNNAVFVETLSGHGLDGQPARNAYAQRSNPGRMRFHTFSSADLAPAGSRHARELVDAFGNPNIVVVTDLQGRGLIDGSAFASLPPERRPGSLAGGVFFFVVNPEDNPDWDWILPWK